MAPLASPRHRDAPAAWRSDTVNRDTRCEMETRHHDLIRIVELPNLFSSNHRHGRVDFTNNSLLEPSGKR